MHLRMRSAIRMARRSGGRCRSWLWARCSWRWRSRASRATAGISLRRVCRRGGRPGRRAGSGPGRSGDDRVRHGAGPGGPPDRVGRGSGGGDDKPGSPGHAAAVADADHRLRELRRHVVHLCLPADRGGDPDRGDRDRRRQDAAPAGSGLLASGIGTVVSLGVGSLSGLGTHDYSLGPIQLPTLGHLTGSQFGWTIALAIAVAVVTSLIMRGGLLTYRFVSRRQMLLVLPAIGLIIGGLAIAYSQITGKGVDEVLFSGQDQLPGLIGQASTWSLAALAWLVLFKGLAYLLSLGSFRGGPTFPALFLGAAAGIMCSHLPGFPLIGSRSSRHGRRDRRGPPAAALSGGARDAADVERRAQGRAADHRRRRHRIRRDARHGTPAGVGVCACLPVPVPAPASQLDREPSPKAV